MMNSMYRDSILKQEKDFAEMHGRIKTASRILFVYIVINLGTIVARCI